MGSSRRALAGACALAVLSAGLVSTRRGASRSDGECNVGVSWNNFEQPRWAATDKPNMQATIEAGGGTFQDFDAKLDSAQQLTDVETLINGGADVLVLLAQDQDAAVTALEVAKNAGVPVIAYDRLIEDPDVLYITFDNVAVGRAEAEAIFEAVPTGQLRPHQGRPGRPERVDVPAAGLGRGRPAGQGRRRRDHRSSPTSSPTAGGPRRPRTTWRRSSTRPTPTASTIDAVLAENDSTALGVVAALQAKGLDPVPLSGQDGDQANLQNVAAGWQYVDVWKDSNELGKVAGAAALQLCAGTRHRRPRHPGRPRRRLRRSRRGHAAPGLHDARRQHRQVVHPEPVTPVTAETPEPPASMPAGSTQDVLLRAGDGSRDGGADLPGRGAAASPAAGRVRGAAAVSGSGCRISGGICRVLNLTCR